MPWGCWAHCIVPTGEGARCVMCYMRPEQGDWELINKSHTSPTHHNRSEAYHIQHIYIYEVHNKQYYHIQSTQYTILYHIQSTQYTILYHIQSTQHTILLQYLRHRKATMLFKEVTTNN